MTEPTHVYTNDFGYGTYGVIPASVKTKQGHPGWFQIVCVIECDKPKPLPIGCIFKPVNPETITDVQNSGQEGQQP